MRTTIGLMSTALLVWACSSEPEGIDAGPRADASARADGGVAADAGSAGDAAPGTDAVPTGDTPIVERPLQATYTCALTRGRTDHAPRQWGPYGYGVVATTAGTPFVARLESRPAMPFDPAPIEFVLSTLAVDGTFGVAITPTPSNTDDLKAPTLARRGDGLALLWMERQGLRFAGFDAAGQRVLGPVSVDPGGALEDFVARPRIAEGRDGGFGVVYVAGDLNGPREVWFLALDRDGVRRSAPRRLATSRVGFHDPAPAVVAAEGGFVVVYGDLEGTRGRVYFTRVDTMGAEVVAPRRISVTDRDGVGAGSGAGFDLARIAVLDVAGGFLVAWPEVDQGDIAQGTGARALVRLVRVDASGVAAGEPVPLRAGELDVDEVEPVLTRVADDAVAVTWARGSHIYQCGGCVPDHRIDLVVVDPVSLARLSEVATVPSPGANAGGLLSRGVAVSGDDVLITYQETYHVHAEPGSAVIRCTR